MHRVEGGGLETKGLVERARRVVSGMHQQRPAGDLFLRDEKTLHGILEQCLAQAGALFRLIDGQARQQGERNRVTSGALKHTWRGLVGFDGRGGQAVIAHHAVTAQRHEGARGIGALGMPGMANQVIIEGRVAAGKFRHGEFGR